jgi:anti-sigma factor RsiW
MTNINDAAAPDETRLLVHAYVDGELDPANALAVERQIAADPALAAERAHTETLRRVLREKLPPRPLPPHLRPRIEAAVGLHRAGLRPSWQALAVSIALALMVASASTWFVMRPAPDDRIIEAVLDGHVRALMAAQPIDVASSDRHTVKPWFNGRIPQSPRVVDLTQNGFPLVGGRIDVIASAPVPTLVYRHRQHLISLSAVSAASLLPVGTMRREIRGYNLIGWSEDGITYWAVSDLGADELDAFARATRTPLPDQ